MSIPITDDQYIITEHFFRVAKTESSFNTDLTREYRFFRCPPSASSPYEMSIPTTDDQYVTCEYLLSIVETDSSLNTDSPRGFNSSLLPPKSLRNGYSNY